MLWVALVGNPSSGRSPALESVLGIARKIEHEGAEGLKEKLRQYEADRLAAQYARQDWEKQVKEATKTIHPRPPMPEAADRAGYGNETFFMSKDEGQVSLGRNRKREIRTQIHYLKIRKLDADKVRKLRGLLAFASDVEPQFVARMKRRYGSQLIDDLMMLPFKQK